MKIVETGVFNRAEPGGRRAVSTFPGLTVVDDKSILAVYRIGPKKDCDDGTIELRWSKDLGSTWSEPSRPFSSIINGVKGTPQVCYVTNLGASHLIAACMWINREAYPGKPLFNPQTEGCLPALIVVADSHDSGGTWSSWRIVPMPEEIGPPSLTNPVLRFADGTLALSVETNKNYKDTGPWHQRVVYLYSKDDGKTWGPPVTVAEDPSHRIFYWDQRSAVASDGTLATFSWTYDRQTSSYLQVHRNLSKDQGKSWLGFEDLGFTDQPSHPAMLPDGRVVVAWVDRFNTSSIRARLASRIDSPFLKESEVVIYEHKRTTTIAGDTAENLVQMGQWSYGLPYAEALPNGEVLVAYYAGTDTCMDCRWARLRV